MPNFERINSNNKIPTSNAYSYDKLLGKMKPSVDNSVIGRTHKTLVSLQDSYNYDDRLQKMSDDEYQASAGCDLSAIFMPFATQSAGSGMPGFVALPPKTDYGITMQRLFPFEYASGVSTVLKDRYHAPSGDSLGSVVSFNTHPINVDIFRSLDDIRSIGIRLPAMGVGWGYTKEKQIAWPSGSVANPASGITYFKGGYVDGYNVDPSDYVTAPIDLRYDEERAVWTSFSTDIVRFKITQTPVEGTPTIALCKKYNGSATRGEETPIALEVSHIINDEIYAVIPVGGIYREPSYQGEKVIWQEVAQLPIGQYQHMHYQMLADNSAGWGLPMGHPILNIVET